MTATFPSTPVPRIGLAACVVGLPEMIPVAKGAGYDLLLVDMEHGRISIDALAGICVTGLAADFPVLARVTGPGSPDLARVLDCGATGVIIPHVDSADQARAIVAACRFAPLGNRAIPGPLAILSFEPVPPAQLIAASEDRVELHAMVESRAGLDAVAEIAAVPGLTALVIGANDLASDLGHTGQLDHPEVRSAFATIAAAARSQGLGFGVMGLPPALIPGHAVANGATLIVATNEINLVVDGARATLGAVRAQLPVSQPAAPA
ncbi:2-keto-3-deoxy-L-rhamnonate aldolase RhmA [Poseidonocella pacifica]|uniref:2-keto-3-deoxy-L-rhamnonate aldolase RhmA n=1 Tax=Poseidonocella pacifica TaxID=871651 RepID=A0A1I0YUB7_9RHOB|nr:aldolase/citrate lyase family protein [Poseidonocella pacifica]SFB16989.1 2-keto-3-deoxy-L-rhamnonate aldolase RhmA [Poseidonocella pacifica]